PYSATGQLLLILATLNILPFFWIITFHFQGRGESLSWILDLSPFVAGLSIIRPEQTMPFSTIHDGQPYFCNHEPSAGLFVYLTAALTVIVLALGLYMAFRVHRVWRELAMAAKSQREKILKTAVVIALLFGFTGSLAGQDEAVPNSEPIRFEVNLSY